MTQQSWPVVSWTAWVSDPARGWSSPAWPESLAHWPCAEPEPLAGRGARAAPGPPHPHLPTALPGSGSGLCTAIKELAITPAKPVPAAGSASLSLKSWPPEQSVVVGRSPRTFPAVHGHFWIYFTHTHTCRHRFALPSGTGGNSPSVLMNWRVVLWSGKGEGGRGTLHLTHLKRKTTRRKHKRERERKKKQAAPECMFQLREDSKRAR